MTEMQIAGRPIGADHPVYVIAELSANHNGRIERALDLIQAAKDAGADAVKIQTYTPDTITISSGNRYFKLPESSLWSGKTLYELYQEAHTPWEWHPRLREEADKHGIPLFSTPFDRSAVDFLEELQVPAYKVASFELVDVPLIEYIAGTGKPIILSTGMATLSEIEEAVNTVRAAGGSQIALLRTNSAYPAPPQEMDLRTIPHLEQAFGCPAGLSDHTLGVAVAVAAVALGARIIEKHITLDRSIPGPDNAFSLEPDEFAQMVEGIRTAEAALGRVRYGPSTRERVSLVSRRSLFAVRDIEQGETFTHSNVRSIRPGHGLHPRYLAQVLGRRARTRIEAGTPLSWDLVGERADQTDESMGGRLSGPNH